MLQDIGDRYPEMQEEHEAVVREAVERVGGVVVRIEGDSFFAAFRSPIQAIRAAVDTQRGLAAHDWPDGVSLRVRMGLHTGEGVPGGGDYIGIDVNRAARIAAVGHGGQILLSDATRGLVEHSLPEGTSLRDLGEHRLKDISYPERLHDLVIDGLPTDFPPPRTLEARPSNLPAQLTSFVGREREVREILALLAKTRLLTLTGPGGTGKTRLALYVAEEVLVRYPDGAFLADLASMADPTLVPSAVARALGVTEGGSRPILDTLKDHLAGKHLLLLVDNFEQVAEAAPVIEDLLGSAPELTVLVTSRTPLSVGGEQEYLVPPLEPPDTENLPELPTLREMDAVRLFTERAASVAPRFEMTEENASAIATIVARLDGLPLAIELAATQIKLLSPEEIASRLDERLTAVGSGPRTAPDRQRTLWDAIAWSYQLLEEPERRLFDRLSVFSGGWTIEAAEEVCEPDGLGLDLLGGLASLVDHSLVRRVETPDAGSRFSMLETIRAFGREQLRARGEDPAIVRRHGEHFLGLALEAEPHLESDPAWLVRCEAEHDNIRAALRWAIAAGEADLCQVAAGSLWRFWRVRGHLTEARLWFDEVLALPSGDGPTAARAKALTGAGGIAWWRGEVPESRRAYEEALAIERELGDRRRTAEALYNLAFPLGIQEGPEAAAIPAEESLELFREIGDESGIARALGMLSMGDLMSGDWAALITRTEDAVAMWRRTGDRFHLLNDLLSLAFTYPRTGRVGEARAAALEALDLAQEVGSPLEIGGALLAVAGQANDDGRHLDAMRLTGAAESLREQVGSGGPPTEIMQLIVGDPAAEARVQLDEDEAERARQEGRAMTLEEAVSEARRSASG